MITQFQSSGKDKTPALCKVFSISRKALPKTHHGFLCNYQSAETEIPKTRFSKFHSDFAYLMTASVSASAVLPQKETLFSSRTFWFTWCFVSEKPNYPGGWKPPRTKKKKVQTFTCHVAAIPLRFNCRTANQGPFAEQWELIRKPLRIGDCFVYWTSSYPDDFCFWKLNITKGICTKLETSSTSRNGNAQWIFDDRRCVQKSVFAAAFAFKEKPR